MKNVFQIVFVLFLVSCRGDSDKQKHAVYDEGALKEFVFSTHAQDEANSLRIIDSTLTAAAEDSTVFRKTVSYLEVPFGDPNSAYRNESLYIKLLEGKIKSKWFGDAEKQTVRAKLNLVFQNEAGHAANDFVYLTAAGYKKRLYDVKSDYTLLFFYNPECNACKDMTMALMNSSTINGKISSNELKVLAIYTDKDEKVWLDHLSALPETWLHGRDNDEYLYKYNVYDLKAMPTLYLLDKDKKVVLKDCMDVGVIEKVISGKL